jgi:ADP-ribosylglycohydrolase/Mrr N-terminal domain
MALTLLSPLPQFEALMLPVLRSLSEGTTQSTQDIRAYVEQLISKVATRNYDTFKHRVAWGLVYLQAARVLKKVSKGAYKIEERGQSLLARNSPTITLSTLREYPEMLQYLAKNAERAVASRQNGNPKTNQISVKVKIIPAKTGGLKKTPKREIPLILRYRGCLLGGAVGDALGAPVEFMDRAAINSRFGSDGIRDFASSYGNVGSITDDTQMTLFTAEGLLRATTRFAHRGIPFLTMVPVMAFSDLVARR